jgi:hypothetical protein
MKKDTALLCERVIIFSPYRNALSEAVLRLQEQGHLTKMKNKWWKEKRGGGACAVSIEDLIQL